eukprot:8179082-Alexandrium_andersonii.AAC.1
MRRAAGSKDGARPCRRARRRPSQMLRWRGQGRRGPSPVAARVVAREGPRARRPGGARAEDAHRGDVRGGHLRPAQLGRGDGGGGAGQASGGHHGRLL